MTQEQKTYETFFVARQPIFDDKSKIWGYELLYRESGTAKGADISDELEATMKVLVNLFLCPDKNFAAARIMINFPERALLGDLPFSLPPQTTVVDVPESLDRAAYFLDAVTRLKKAGYMVAIGDYGARPDSAALCGLADIIAVDVLGKSQEELEALLASAKGYGARFLAKRIEDHKVFQMVRKLGFSLFQGYFFKKPNLMAGRKITSTEVSRMRLFQAIEQEEPDFKALAEAIETDVSITYRLLTFLNSPTFGFSGKITSVRQAVVMAGWKQIKSWLRLVVFTDLSPPEKTKELSYLSAQRAKFLELAAASAGRPDLSDSLFLLGLFSLLEPMLDLPIQDVLAHLPLDERIASALRRDPASAYAPWLALVEGVEGMPSEDLEVLIASLRLGPDALLAAYKESLDWANKFFAV